MKNLKLGILGCGVVLLVLILTNDFVESLKEVPGDVVLIVLGAALATGMGALGMARPPFRPWQGIGAIAGFGLVAVKTKLWELAPDFLHVELKDELLILSIGVGILLALLSIAKPEDPEERG